MYTLLLQPTLFSLSLSLLAIILSAWSHCLNQAQWCNFLHKQVQFPLEVPCELSLSRVPQRDFSLLQSFYFTQYTAGLSITACLFLYVDEPCVQQNHIRCVWWDRICHKIIHILRCSILFYKYPSIRPFFFPSSSLGSRVDWSHPSHQRASITSP